MSKLTKTKYSSKKTKYIMSTRNYSNYNTDEQRIAIANKRNGTAPNWYTVDEWAEQAKTSRAREILRNIAIRLFRLEEYATYGEL